MDPPSSPRDYGETFARLRRASFDPDEVAVALYRAGEIKEWQKIDTDCEVFIMDNSFNQKLIDLLKKDNRFIDEDGELLKQAVIDQAYKIDKGLVKLLLSDKHIKDKFFDEIEKHWIFNINTFIEFISDKNFLDNSYTRFRNKIGLTIDGKYLKERGEVCLVWPYKDCVLEGGQTKEEEKRKEIFFNEVLAQDEIDRLLDPKVLTNFKRFTPEGGKKVAELKRDENGTIRENLIIKGNNLLALHCLKKQFAGKVKLIYLDPPYNIGDDAFGYNDNFNSSAWLTFMKNRLEIARELLAVDGAIFVQIDHHELGHLNILLDEVFGENNKVQEIAVKVASPSGFKAINPGPIDVTEFILFYAKNKKSFNFKVNRVPAEYHQNYDLYVEKHKDLNKWKFISLKDKVLKENGFESENQAKQKYKDIYKYIIKNLISDFAFKNAENVVSIRDLHKPSDIVKKLQEESRKKKGTLIPYKKQDGTYTYLYNGGALAFYSSKIHKIDGELQVTELLSNFWDHISWAGIAKEGGVRLKNGKKPEKLIKQILEITANPKDIVLDFFTGSGTTAAVAHKMGMQYIGVEQIDYGDDDSVTRLKNVIGKKKKGLVEEYENYDTSGISKAVKWQGGGDFVYCELKKYNESYMDKIQDTKTSKELGKLWKEIAENSFLNWYINPEMPAEAVKYFEEIGKTENGFEKQKKLLCELLNKNQLYVNLSEIDDKQFNVSKEDKGLNKAFYGEDY